MTTEAAETEDRDDEDGPLYYGSVIIEWPAPFRPGEVRPLVGFRCVILDAETGKPVPGVSKLFIPAVTAAAQAFITCELTMDADEDGKPVFEGEPHTRDGEIIRGTFHFLVAEMRIRT